MTVTVYRSDDASAPAGVSNTAGLLATVLDACLVNGYGAKAAAGWSIAYTGTNKRAYRTGSGTNQRYLRLDDTGTSTARIVGYESMSDVDTGTNPFPTAAQVSGGLYVTKSTDATVRPWMVIANERFAYIYIGYLQTVITTSSTRQGMYAFGDFTSYLVGDAYNTLIIGDTSGPDTSANTFGSASPGTPSATTGHYMCRAASGTVGAVQFGKTCEHRGTSDSNMGTTGITYPSPINNGLELKPVFVYQISSGARGVMPGLWNPNHNLPANHFDTFTGGSGSTLDGRSFILVDTNNTSNRCRVALETSDTWS